MMDVRCNHKSSLESIVIHQIAIERRRLQMRNNAFVPRDYDVFAGLDVDKKSISVTLKIGDVVD